MIKINFKEITENPSVEEIKFLYTLLKNQKHNISNDNETSFIEHEKFVRNNPYYKWVLIFNHSELIGSLYINQDNSVHFRLLDENQKIGIEIINHFYSSFIPQPEIKSSRCKKFFFNINPNNIFMKKLLESSGHMVSQISFSRF